MADANVEQEAAKFLDKVGDEDKKDPKKLASKLYAVRYNPLSRQLCWENIQNERVGVEEFFPLLMSVAVALSADLSTYESIWKGINSTFQNSFKVGTYSLSRYYAVKIMFQSLYGSRV